MRQSYLQAAQLARVIAGLAACLAKRFPNADALQHTIAFVCWSVQARRRSGLAAVATEQDHTEMMGLVEEGDDRGSTIYSLGLANRFRACIYQDIPTHKRICVLEGVSTREAGRRWHAALGLEHVRIGRLSDF